MKVIEIKKRNKLIELFHALHSKLEDMLFNIIQKLPDRFIPSALMIWINRYIEKRITELNKTIIRNRWNSMELEKVINNL